MVEEIKTAESLKKFFPKLSELIKSNWQETGDRFDLDLDLNCVGGWIESGKSKAYIASIDDEVVGYALVFVTPTVWNQSKTIFTVYGLYVKPEYRGSYIAGKMLLMIEREAKRSGAFRIDFSLSKSALPFDFLSRGYEDVGVTFGKFL